MSATNQVPQLEPAKLAELITGYASDVKAQEIVELDLRGVLGYTDYFVIASGGTDRQVKAVHDRIHENMKKEHGLLPRRVEGVSESRWILMDYLDVIVHIFTPDAREFYRLEQLWGEAPKRTSTERERATSWAALSVSGASRARTGDLVTASHALSQLSYSPVERVRRGIGYRELLVVSRRRQSQMDLPPPAHVRDRDQIATAGSGQ